MLTLSDLEQRALELPEGDRAALAAHLLDSLPPVLADEDEGITEALRRDAELEKNTAVGMTMDELRRSLGRQA